MTDHEERRKRMQEEIRQRQELIRKAEAILDKADRLYKENDFERGVVGRYLDSDRCNPELRDKVRAKFNAFEEKMRGKRNQAAKKHMAESQGSSTQARKKPKMNRTMV